VHVKDNPGLGEAPQVGENVRYDAAWDARKGKMKGINLSFTGAGSVGCYGGGGGQSCRKIGKVNEYHLPDFSSEDNETPSSWEHRARALLKEWKDTFQRQSKKADKSGRGYPLYEIDYDKAV